jgi:glycosyltransferase involved in cell wall biosynthesis
MYIKDHYIPTRKKNETRIILLGTVFSLSILLYFLINLYNYYKKDENGISEFQKEKEILEMKSKFVKSKLQIVNNKLNDNTFPSKYMLCFTFPGFFSYGGVEQWFWSLKDVFLSQDFTIHAVKVIDSWAPSIPSQFETMGILFNPSFLQMQIECDLNIMTGSHPIKRLTENELQLLVIHGGFGCSWTESYAKYYKHYNSIVTVSQDSSKFLGDDERLSIHIPSLIKIDSSNCDLKAPCNKTVTFIGRISSEKRPELFCQIINELPEEYCGWLIGPHYYEESIPKFCSNRIHVIGPTNNPQCAIRKSYIIINTSSKEGGPIVAIESWLNRKPYFMFKTGLGYLMNLGVLKDENPRKICDQIINTNLNDVVKESDIILNKHFNPNNLIKNWFDVLTKTIKSKGLVKPIHIDLAVGGYIQNHGRSRTLFCYKYCIFGNTLKYWQFPGNTFVTFSFLVESDYGTKSIKFEVGSKENMYTQMFLIDDKLSRVSVPINTEKDISWRISMSETIITLYSIDIV